MIRQEKETDFAAVKQLLQNAFEGSEEADLVEQLRADQAFVPELSLVAEINGKITGYILFTRIKIKAENGVTHESLALAPMAVLPELQNSGIGSKLVEAGLQKAKNMGYTSVIVLGHPEYYPRFGFKQAANWGIRAPFEVPSEVFMALELEPGALQKVNGVVTYAAPFSQV